jgi:ABC-type multidrug transport system ATPase subunit
MTACECIAVSRRIGGHPALHQVSLAVESGEVLGIIGPNGAGKTTLLRVLAGVLNPSSGLVRRTPSSMVSYFGGERTLPPDVSAKRWVGLWSSEGARDTPSSRFAVLSRGTRQQVGLRAALAACRGGLLILDEPWEGLDPDASRWLSHSVLALRAMGTAIAVSSHRMHDLADVCDRCLFLQAGRLAPVEVVCQGQPDRVAALYAAFDGLEGRA